MPRKRTQSAIEKAKRTPEEKAAAKEISRFRANRRYRRKLKREAPEKARDRMAKRRAAMTEEEKAAAKEKRKQYDSKYYLTHRDNILTQSLRKRASAYIQKHGEYAYWTDYPSRNVNLRKSLGEGLLPETVE